MAESLLFALAESLIGKLASVAVKEASLVLGVHKDLKDMSDYIALIKGVLLDAEQKTHKSNALIQWLKQVNNVISDAADILDDFQCEALRKQVVNTYGSTSGKLQHFFSTSNPFVYRHRMGHQIEDLKKRLDKVAADRLNFGLAINENDTRVVYMRELTYSHVNPSNVIGREHDKKKIIDLLKKDGHNKSLSVVPIVGFGGLGKTTLAKLVFNDTDIGKHFSLKMWVCISNDFKLKNVLVKILNSIPNKDNVNFEKWETEQLQNHLRNALQYHKFLMVLDDVWNEERDFWGELRDILSVGVEGSKVLVTTRIDKIASMMQPEPSNCYPLKGLSPKDSFSIFVKCAFEEGEEKKHPQLLEIGKEIVGKCKGIPLALKTLGSSLFLKFDEGEWKSVNDSAIWDLQQKETDIMPILQFSYYRLPSHLKPCFACLSLFPEDFHIASFSVIAMWEALGFIQPQRESETVDDVANRYLRELHSRSFLTDFIDWDRSCRFRLHDLMRDLAIYIAKGEFQIIYTRIPPIFNEAKHLAFMENDMLGKVHLSKGLRTMLFPWEAINETFLNTLVSTCKYLRILDLSGSKYESLPPSIGKLKFLKYLCLQFSAKLKSLPDSLCKLQSLQTLNLKGCIEIQKLPKGIRELISLRQLVITTKQADADFPDKEIANMTSIENLQFYNCDNLELLFEEIQHFNLKSLRFSRCQSLRYFSFHVFRSLESLFISKCRMLDLSLGLGNQIPLSCLKLLILNSLPQLVTLPMWLQRSSNTLNTLVIMECFNLEHLPEWLSTMTSLRTLRIEYCPRLLTLPDNMHHLTNLERLTIGDCPVLWSRYHPQFGQDRHKISHIKHVIMRKNTRNSQMTQPKDEDFGSQTKARPSSHAIHEPQSHGPSNHGASILVLSLSFSWIYV
ncbi:hypothetical protein VNO78_21341 [Psophocarpus tetragonolobus]|uniref:Disease resistance protein RGA3 n=1 Tax=Psophocarpus tetragonolobus TaxID=3891 RepID=A0AAN9SBJ4_PSOTE